jgi:flagellar M-ring protein FliF
MSNLMAQLGIQLREIMAGMPASRRVAIGLFVGVVISSLVGLMMWTGQPELRVLYTGLSQSDAGAVVTRLREQRIPFEYDEAGGVVRVPANKIHETRLAMAEENLPSGGGLGFEIFDRSSLGVTNFVQKVNFLRALQGELARTISQLRTVESARVHIVMPDRSLFAEEKREPSASVVVNMAGGSNLPKSQVNSIVHLVASGVEGLDSKNVTVVDTQGNILAGGQDTDSDLLNSSKQEFEVSLERRLERRVETMLANVVGPGRAVARVDVELNMRRVERTREVFDPDKQVERSVRRIKESNESGLSGSGRVPGVSANVPDSEKGDNPAGGGKKDGRKSSRVSETVNFEIDKTIERIVEPVGQVRRISAAVMVDGTYTGGSEGAERKFQARSQAELENFTQLVSAALGLKKDRGDTIKIVSVPFQASPKAAGEESMPVAQQAFVMDMAKIVMGIIGLAFIFIFVVRPLMNWISSMELKPAAGSNMLPGAQENLALPGNVPVRALNALEETLERTPEEQEMEATRQVYEEVYEYVTENPDKTADLIRNWVRDSRV